MTLKNRVTPISNFDFKGNEILSVNLDGRDLFYGKPIAQLLEYVRPVKAINDHVKSKHRLTLKQSESPKLGLSNFWLGNDHQPKTFIDVSGIYSLVLHSTLPQAEEFQDWVTDEVLPQIQQTGGYNKSQPKLPTTPQEMTKALLENMNANNEDIKSLKTDVNELKNERSLSEPEYSYIAKTIGKKVHMIVEDKGLNQEQTSLLYDDINGAVLKLTGVKFRTRLKIKHFDDVCELINSWYPSADTVIKINKIGRQTNLDV